MTNIIHSIHKYTLRILDIFSALLLVAMLFTVMIQVIARYVFVASTPWTDEGSRILMIWICFIGSSSMMIRGEHLMVDVFYHKFSDRTKRYLHLVFNIVTLLLAAVLLFYSYRLLTNRMIRNGSTTVIHLPLFWYYGSLPISMGIITAYEILNIAETISGMSHRQTERS